MDIQLVYMTAGGMEEARRISKVLVQDQLAACVNILNNMNSFYMWKGQLQDDQEVVMIAKTTAELVPALTARVKEVHSYDCPCVVALPVSGGNTAFLQWIADEVGDGQ